MSEKFPKPVAIAIQKRDVMSRPQKATYTFFVFIGLVLTFAFGFWWFEPAHVAHNFSGKWHLLDVLIFVILSYLVWHQIIMELFTWYVAGFLKKPAGPIVPQTGLRVAYLTAFVPGSEPYDILDKSLAAMVKVDYPHDTWLLDEGDDDTAKKICAKHGVNHFSRKGIEKYNTEAGRFKKKTKGGNYNSWLDAWGRGYDIVAQHDVDFIPKKNFLLRTLGYFRDPKVAFVGTPQIYGNEDDSWIAKGAAEQAYGFYGPLQQGFYGHDMTLFIGANHLVRISTYDDINGYSPHIAEDMLTGMKLYEKHWKGVYVPEILLVGEGPASWDSYLIQQMRWAYGCMDIVFRHAPFLFLEMRPVHVFNYILLQQFYFMGIAQVLGVVLLILYFLFGIASASMEFMPIVIFYIPLLLFQLVFQLWLQNFNIDPAHERGLLLRGKLLAMAAWPIYFLAFMKVLRGNKLVYSVTPKGTNQRVARYPGLFVPHLILGLMTLFGMIAGHYLGHTAESMLFWATINTVFMLYFYFAEAIPVILGLFTAPFRKEKIRKELKQKSSITIAVRQG